MHARHRNTGNGYRSGSMGMDLSLDGSMRGRGFYNSGHRGFNRGFGRVKQYQPIPSTPPAQRKSGGDIFIEAGGLAAEYLVSRGMLPPSVLSGKWQSGKLNKQPGEFQDFRSQVGRMGGSASDVDRRRYADEYSSIGSRNNLKGKRNVGPCRYGSDFRRDFGRSGSWSDRNKASHEMEACDDTASGRHEEQPVTEDIASSIHRSASGDFARNREGEDDSESGMDKDGNIQDEAQSRADSFSVGKETVHDGEISKMSQNSSSFNTETVESKDGAGNGGETENQSAMKSSSVQHCTQTDEKSIKNGVDLVALCKFAKVPTKTRSALTMKAAKVDLSENNEGSTDNTGLSKGIKIPVQCDSPDPSAIKTHDPECPDSENSKSIHPLENAGDFDHAHVAEKGKCQRSQSFSDNILSDYNEKESGFRSPVLQRSYSVEKGRGEKRVLEDSDFGKGTKRLREWIPSVVSMDNKSFSMFDVSENKASPQEKTHSSCEKVTLDVDHGSLANNSTSPSEQWHKSSAQYTEGRQLFPSSFKICDLNLMGTSDANENNLSDPMLIYPRFLETKKEALPTGFDLLMSSSSKPVEYATRISNGKEIEVIDLDNDSQEEIKASDSSDKKQEATFLGFSHQPQTSGDIADVPDYNEGLMMVEFLDSFGNVPPINPGINRMSEGIGDVSQGVNPLQNEIGVRNAEGTLGAEQETQVDDDSIFMSLGEIPLTFLHAWDQPPRGHEKPF